MLKSYRVSILIVSFFTIAAFLNENGPAEIANLTSSIFGAEHVTSTKLGLVESFDLPTFILLSSSIICGLFLIAYLKLSRTGKIISVQSARLERQEEELQQARLLLENGIQSKEDITYSNELTKLSPVSAQRSWIS